MFDPNYPPSLQDRTLNLTVALYRVTDYFPKAEILRSHLRAKANEIFERMTEYGSAPELESEIRILIQKIWTIKGYLAIASTLNYVRSLNFAILEKEYGSIEQFLEREKIKFAKRPIHEDIQQLARNHAASPIAEKNLGRPAANESIPENKRNVPEDQMGAGGFVNKTDRETPPPDALFYERAGVGLNERQTIIMDQMKESKQAKISDFYTSFHGVSSKTIQRDLQSLVDRQILKKEGEKRWTVYSLI